MRKSESTSAHSFAAICAQAPISLEALPQIGQSRGGRPLHGCQLGHGRQRISLIAGCHADEPTGSLFLQRLIPYLQSLPQDHPLCGQRQWWIIPNANPDGSRHNRAWTADHQISFDFTSYLAHACREEPADDVEFGFPRHDKDGDARIENRCIVAWWQSAGGPFATHVSLHSLPLGSGPWFLLDPAWAHRCEGLQKRCRQAAAELGYGLHDENRKGKKGFDFIAPGFSTCPTAAAMQGWFRADGDEKTAAAFRPGSMEAVHRLGGNPFCVVSEMPLFLVPAPFDAAWRKKWKQWLQEVQEKHGNPTALAKQACQKGLHPMPIADQMRLQWELILAAVQLQEPVGPRRSA